MNDEKKLTCLTSYLDEHPEWEGAEMRDDDTLSPDDALR